MQGKIKKLYSSGVWADCGTNAPPNRGLNRAEFTERSELKDARSVGAKTKTTFSNTKCCLFPWSVFCTWVFFFALALFPSHRARTKSTVLLR